MERIAVWFGIGSLVCALAGDVSADELKGVHLRAVTEVSHSVSVSLRQRQVVYKVRRSFRNTAKRADELRLELTLPTGGVASALRVRMAGRWYQGALLGHKKAQSVYDALTSKGPERRRGPALMSWQNAGKLVLNVFPISAGGELTIEYQLRAPACYSDGQFLANYHAVASKGSGLVVPSLRAGRPGAVLNRARLLKRLGRTSLDNVCGGKLASSGDHYIAFNAPRRQPLTAKLANYRVGPKSYIVGYDLDVARVLLPRPKRARVVFVVDASRSVGLANVRSQLSLIRGYISQLKDATFEVVLYRRFADRLFGNFLNASAAVTALQQVADARIKPGNGSNLERGMGLATKLLSGFSGPQRVIAFTDSRFRRAFWPGQVARATANGKALVHYVDLKLGYGRLRWQRDDRHQLATVASNTGGIVATMSGRTRSLAASGKVMGGLVAPDKVYDFRVVGLARHTGLSKPQAYGEGRGFRGIYVSKNRVSSLKVFGKVWGRSIALDIKPDRRMSRALPSLVFGTIGYSALSKKQVGAVARVGGVVSPATSLLTRHRRMRSTSYQGYTGGFSRSYSFSSRCGGVRPRLTGFGTRGPRRIVTKPAYGAILRTGLVDRIAGCDLLHSKAKNTRLGVTIETTRIEIVDVAVTGGDDKLRRCVREAAWELALDERFQEQHGRYSFNYATKFGRSSCAASGRQPCSQTPSKTRAGSTTRR